MGGPPILQQIPGYPYSPGLLSQHPTGQAPLDARAQSTYVPPLLKGTKGAQNPAARAKTAEEKPRREFRIPTPEELGIGLKTEVLEEAPDWSLVRKQLAQLGATRFALDQQGDKYSFSFFTAKGRVEAFGRTEKEAVDAALKKASAAQ